MLAKSVRRILIANYYTASAILIIINAILLSCDPPLKAYNPSNTAPEIPSNLIPADNSLNLNTNITLYWHCADHDGDSLKYDVYFGYEGDPPLVAANISDTTYNPQILEYNTIYFWKIDAFDSYGDSVSSAMCSFETRSFSDIHLISFSSISVFPSEWYSLTASENIVLLAGVNSPMLIYDVSDPSQPVVVSDYGNADLWITQIILRNQMAFIAEANFGLEIVDVSNPQSPTRIGAYAAGGYANSMAVVDNYAYLAGGRGVVALDISNPSHPILLDTSSVGIGIMKVIGNYAYSVGSCGFEQSCLRWFEIRNRTSFTFVNSIDLIESTPTAFESDYRYLFIADNQWKLNAYSLISPSDPQLVYSFPQQPFSGLNAPYINGDLLYTANWDSAVFGIKIFNIVDILNPVEMASWTYQHPIMIIHVANNQIYAIDNTPRLLILDYMQ
jgi:hypothetical protein